MSLTKKDSQFEVRKLTDLARGNIYNPETKKLESRKTTSVEDLLSGILKGITLIIKLLVDVRENQTRQMRKEGVELRRVKKEENKEKETV